MMTAGRRDPRDDARRDDDIADVRARESDVEEGVTGLSAYGMLQLRTWTRTEEATVVAPRHLMVGLRWSSTD